MRKGLKSLGFRLIPPVCLLVQLFAACEIVDDDLEKHTGLSDSVDVSLGDVAEILAAVPIETIHLKEVHAAVTSSSGNGYDEEYTMRDLFERPGAGVGDAPDASDVSDVSDVKSSDFSANPLKELIAQHVRGGFLKSKAGGGCPCEEDPELFLKALMESDVQIYWPFSDSWDGETYPVITFDPMDGGESNVGYMIIEDSRGRRIEKVIVDEKMASEHPVWVVNRNSDAEFKTLELIRREDPGWGEGGGSIIVNPSKSQGCGEASCFSKSQGCGEAAGSSKSQGCVEASCFSKSQGCGETAGSSKSKERSEGSGMLSGNGAGENQAKRDSGLKSLILKDFVMKRNFDTWFAGASEFFVKAGYVKDFTASTEAELKLYNPSVTDFMVVVKRSQLGKVQSFNAMLISDWSPQMDACAFMITEDDGGTRTEWKCTALVRIASKSYGFEMVLPFNSRDDVVWRGQLSNRWLESETDIVSHFGDVDVTFSVI